MRPPTKSEKRQIGIDIGDKKQAAPAITCGRRLFIFKEKGIKACKTDRSSKIVPDCVSLETSMDDLAGLTVQKETYPRRQTK